jgi:hypothetical protein
MSVEVKIVGFDRGSDLFEKEWDVPIKAMPQIRKIAHVPDTDPHLLGSYRSMPIKSA